MTRRDVVYGCLGWGVGCGLCYLLFPSMMTRGVLTFGAVTLVLAGFIGMGTVMRARLRAAWVGGVQWEQSERQEKVDPQGSLNRALTRETLDNGAFTREDVDELRDAASAVRTGAILADDEATAASLESIASRVAALLPPEVPHGK